MGVEPVLYLCAVSLNSSCEDFIKPNPMMKRNTKISRSGSPQDFAHENQFSILASDDNESVDECCKSTCTTKVLASETLRQQRGYDGERADGRDEAPAAEVLCQQRGSRSPKLSAHRVSYLSASGVESKGVHHVGGSGWRKNCAIMDSGSFHSWRPRHLVKDRLLTQQTEVLSRTRKRL